MLTFLWRTGCIVEWCGAGEVAFVSGDVGKESRERGEGHVDLARGMQDDGCGASPLGTLGVGNLVLRVTSFDGLIELVLCHDIMGGMGVEVCEILTLLALQLSYKIGLQSLH